MTYALIAALLAAEPDAPTRVELTPTAHEARVEALACKKDLDDCMAKDRVEWKWVVIAAGSGVVAGVAIGVALGATLAKR